MAIEYHYKSPGPVADEFLRSDSFVTGIRGPIGSGKSTACVMKAIMISQAQPIQKDGRRHSRGAIIRNTYPELTTTTIKTWHQWVPETLGKWKKMGPPTHHIVDDALDMEVLFLALDSPQDVRKLLSLELTWAWINEAREVPKAIVDGLTGRVGRFPPKRDGGCTNPQIIMDTNSPEVDHWWYVLAEQDRTSERNAQLVDSVLDAEREMRAAGTLGKKQRLFTFLAQPDGLSPDAENTANLRSDYYSKASAGKTDEWKNVYVRSQYGFVQDGRPVYPEFRETLHVRTFELNPRLPLTIGIDFGLTPAATIGQRSFTGIHRVRWEVVTEHMGAKQFAQLLRGFISEHCQQFQIEHIAGDPAGMSDSQTNSDETCFKILKANGIDAKPAPTNDPTVRREAHAQAMTRLIDGEAGWQVHPQGCPTLRRGMAGQYRYKRVAVAGSEDRYHEKPDKNSVSHVCEADQYRMLGAGEGRVVLRGTLGGKRSRPTQALM